MTTPEQPDGQGLTRKQLRELQKKGGKTAAKTDAAAPAVEDAPDVDATAEFAIDAAPADAVPEAADAQPEAAPIPEVAPAPDIPPPPPLPAPAVHLPRAADPVVSAPPPTPDSQVDLGVSPLTRRQAREQERIRTASVPVITPEVAAAHAAPWAPPTEPAPAIPAVPAIPAAAAAAAIAGEVDEPSVEAEPTTAEVTLEELFGATDTDEVEVAEAELIDEAPSAVEEQFDEESAGAEADSESEDAPVEAPVDEPRESHSDEVAAEAVAAEDVTVEAEEPAVEDGADEDAAEDEVPAEVLPEPEAKPLLRPEFGSALLAGTAEPEVQLPASFDDLMARNGSSTGSMSMPNALILSQTPSPMVGPVTATGEVLITGSMALPEGLGSRGHAPGVTDGKEIDSVLVDGELPAASSPTPIAASAAISTIKGTGEIIRPPAPEKGNRLMLTLAITAGVLALALVGVLILAFVTGVF